MDNFLSSFNIFSYLKEQFEAAFSGTLSETVNHALDPETVDFLGIAVNPSFYTALIVSVVLILFAAAMRIFVIPKFKKIPGKFQILLETFVSYFDKSSVSAVHRHANFIGPYVLTAATFIALSTLVELIGLRPALASINTCFAMGITTFILINLCGVRQNGVVKRIARFKNPINIITDMSVPLSLSLRLFGSIMSGFIIMELVYSVVYLSFVLPAAVSVITTFLHALVQSYLFATLTNIFVGEAVELHHA